MDKENYIQSSLNQTPEQAEKEKKHRESQIKAEKKKGVKKKKVVENNIKQQKGCNKGATAKVKQCTAKQEAFARQYLVARCKVAAYRYAYNIENMSEKVIYNKSYEVYNTPIVYNRIMELQEEQNQRFEISADRITQEFAKLAFTHLPGIVGYDGIIMTVAQFNNLSEPQRACIKEFECVQSKVGNDKNGIKEVEKIKVKVYDKISALSNLGKINGMYVDKSEVNVSGHIMNFSGEDKGVL